MLLMIIMSSSFLSSIKTSAQEKILIFPIPQEIQITGDAFALDDKMSIIVPVNRSEKDISVARSLVRELSDKYGMAGISKVIKREPVKAKKEIQSIQN